MGGPCGRFDASPGAPHHGSPPTSSSAATHGPHEEFSAPLRHEHVKSGELRVNSCEEYANLLKLRRAPHDEPNVPPPPPGGTGHNLFDNVDEAPSVPPRRRFVRVCGSSGPRSRTCVTPAATANEAGHPERSCQNRSVQDDTHIGIGFVDAGSATAHLHTALRAAVNRFPDDLAAADIPDDPAAFRTSYPEALPRFEAARAGSSRRAEIARAVVAAADERLVMQPDSTPIHEAVAREAEPPRDGRHIASTGTRDCTHRSRSTASLARVTSWSRPCRRWSLAARRRRRSPTPSPGSSSRPASDGIDLSGRRIAMLGAGAELAPTRLWLEGGADVLWIDVADPPADLLDRDDLAGTLRWVPGGTDLLTEPDRVRATVEEFAAGERIDLGLYAYAGGHAREWRLTAAMNAIVDALPAGTVHGVAMLLSPTTCGVLTDAELAGEATRRAGVPRGGSARSIACTRSAPVMVTRPSARRRQPRDRLDPRRQLPGRPVRRQDARGGGLGLGRPGDQRVGQHRRRVADRVAPPPGVRDSRSPAPTPWESRRSHRRPPPRSTGC